MKNKPSISLDTIVVRRLRNDPDFSAEYLKVALEDKEDSRVLLIALRRLAQVQPIAKVVILPLL